MSLNENEETQKNQGVEIAPNKETTQQTISYSTEDVVEMPEALKAVIISVEKKRASEVFGKENLKGDDRDVLHITYENKDYNITNHDTIGYFPNGAVPDRSKLAKFLKRYKSLEVGTTVDILKNSEGFYKLRYD